MVLISNGKESFRVAKSAVKMFRPAGFYIIEEGEGANLNVTPLNSKDDEAEELTEWEEESTEGELTEDEKFLEEVLEKPVSKWSKEEIKRYAELKDIDLTGVESTKEARELVKASM